jgi:hypothetical protein
MDPLKNNKFSMPLSVHSSRILAHKPKKTIAATAHASKRRHTPAAAVIGCRITTTKPESDDTDDCTLMTAPGQSYCNIVESRGDQYGQFSTWTLPSLCCTTLPLLHILETRCSSDMMRSFHHTPP